MDSKHPLHPNITPEIVPEKLPRDSFFVFGSNIHGMHRGGAARTARLLYGAIEGVGVGTQGQAYAIPTMEGIEITKLYVDQFIEIARIMSYCKFYVTRIGCGIAGYRDEEIATLFAKAFGMKNVYLPESFVEVLEKLKAKNYDGEMSGMQFWFE